MFVLDLGRFGHLLVFDEQGRHLGGINWQNEHRMPTDLRVSDAEILVTTTARPEKGTAADVLHRIDSGGRSRGTGCRVDPRVVTSDRQQGMMGAMVFASLSVRGGRIYCAQPTSPIVQVMDMAGRTLQPITVAPPFYIGPVDKPLSMNQKEVMAYNATFTTHVSFQATGTGFVSTYSRYDTTEQRNKFMVFACDSASGQLRCGSAEPQGRVLHVSAPDTLYVEEPRVAGGVRVGRYRLLPGAD